MQPEKSIFSATLLFRIHLFKQNQWFKGHFFEYMWQWVIKDYKFKLKWHKRKNFVKILHVKAIWDTKFIKISKIKLSSQVHLHPYIFKTAFSFGKNSTTKKHDWIFSHSVISTNPFCSCISWIFSELFRFFYPWKAWNCLVKDNWT